jgi:hypothetical protein
VLCALRIAAVAEEDNSQDLRRDTQLGCDLQLACMIIMLDVCAGTTSQAVDIACQQHVYLVGTH